jgi:hypothetical protein
MIVNQKKIFQQMDNKQKQQAIEYKEIEILFSEKSFFFFCRT